MFFLNNLKILALICSSLIFVGINNLLSHDCLSMNVAKEILNGFPNEPITVLEKNITLEEAYCGQEKLNFLINRKHKDKIGYKVGFTGKHTQDMFNISEPATGVIYNHMFLKNNGRVDHKFGYRTFIEPDFMVIIKNNKIMSAKTDLEILENITSFHPFVEIISVRFEENEKLNAKMVIASNMLATKMVMGEGIKAKNNEEFLNKINSINTIFIKNNDTVLQEEKVSNLMGGPMNVLKWLINDFNKKGIVLKKNDRISLGSVGKLFPLEKNSQYKYSFQGISGNKSLIINVD